MELSVTRRLLIERSSQDLAGHTSFTLPARLARKIVTLKANEAIFSQGDPTTHLFYIRKGTVKLSVLSGQGKEAVLAVLHEGSFVGEDSLAGQPFHIFNATTLGTCSLEQIEGAALLQLLHRDARFSDRFMSYLISRTLKVEEDLADRLFNSTEKRLARTLLALAQHSAEKKPTYSPLLITHATLATLVGTTRSRVSTFMNRFKKLGLIDYNVGGVHVNSSLLTVVLHD